MAITRLVKGMALVIIGLALLLIWSEILGHAAITGDLSIFPAVTYLGAFGGIVTGIGAFITATSHMRFK